MWLIIFAVVLLILYFKVIKIYNYWENKGVPYVKPWPVFGNFASNFFQRRALPYLNEDFYKTYPNKRYVGIYQFLQPTLIIRDPELIRKIAVKEFDTFPNHSIFINTKDADPFGGRNIFNLTNEGGWHKMRTTLSPSFTASKMRSMFVLMEQCADKFMNYFLKQENTVTINMKDAFTRYTNDVIATTAFGVTCDSLANPENEFYLMGKSLTEFKGIGGFIFLGFVAFPKLMKLLNVPFFKEEVSNFFHNIIKETLKVRREKGIVRPDMLHLLMEAQENGLKHDNQSSVVDSGFAVVQESEISKKNDLRKAEITDIDITAQAIGFFFGGFETTANLLCYAAYELAVNPTVQERLQEEVDSVTESHEKITYEILLGMKYLDLVISETLRKWPPSIITDRKSVKPFKLEAEQTGEDAVLLDKGTLIWIPIYGIQRDPKYYPDPERFDPERFSAENKHNIKPFTYMPFGAGPRNCIASRFALLETKLLIVKILQHFDIVPTMKTIIPLEYSKKDFSLLPDGGMWLGLKPRKITT